MKLLIILVTVLVSRIACLSLDEIHSSSKTFKSISHNNKDKSLKNAIDTIHRRRQEYPTAQFYGSYSLPIQAIRYYERLVPFNKKPDQQIVNDLLGYNQIDSQYLDESLANDLLTTELALKLSQLLESDKKGEFSVGHRVYNRINRKRKRSASKHNYFSQMNNINKESKNVKNQSKHKNNSIKTLIKRKSGRRVLNDHFNIEENHQNVINKDKKSSTNSVKQKPKSNKKIENKIKGKTLKKTIRKRKAELSMSTDTSLETNDSKKTTKDFKTTDKSVVLELNDILSDDNRNDKKENDLNIRVENKTQKLFNPLNNTIKERKELIKKKTKRSDPNIDSLIENLDQNNENNDKMSDDIIVYPIIDETEERVDNKPTTEQNLNELLRKEFYENMAKTLATMRRKRSDQLLNDESDAINDDMEESETIGNNLIPIDESSEDRDNTNDRNQDFKKSKIFDDSDNDYVIATIDDDIKDTNYANDGSDVSDGNEEEDLNQLINDWNTLDEKNKIIKSKRSVSPYFGDLEDDIETNEINSKRFSRVTDNLESIEDTLLTEALDIISETAAKGSEDEVNTNSITNRVNAAYDIEDMRTALEDLKTNFDKINDENNNEIEETFKIYLPSPPYTTDQIDVHKKDSLFENSLTESKSDSNCFVLDLLSSDCSSVADLLPTEGLRYSFTESCNWHQICYTCGEIYGLLSSDCDAGFLEASRLSCAGSPSCEAFARLVLSPLRQSRVFYKSSVPQTCYQFQCIRDFLFDSQNTKI